MTLLRILLSWVEVALYVLGMVFAALMIGIGAIICWCSGGYRK